MGIFRDVTTHTGLRQQSLPESWPSPVRGATVRSRANFHEHRCRVKPSRRNRQMFHHSFLKTRVDGEVAGGSGTLSQCADSRTTQAQLISAAYSASLTPLLLTSANDQGRISRDALELLHLRGDGR